MLMALTKEVDNMQQQMGNINRKVKNLRLNQKEVLEIKSMVTEMKNAFDGLDMAKEKNLWRNVNRIFQN